MTDFSLILSLLSLSVSGYALYRGGPRGSQGEKGDSGDTGARGPKGEHGDASELIKRDIIKVADRNPAPRTTIEPAQRFLSKEARREQIAELAYDEDFQTRLIEIRERLKDGSGLIAADPDAQSNQVDWRKRNAR